MSIGASSGVPTGRRSEFGCPACPEERVRVPTGRWPSADPARASERRQRVQFAPQPPIPAASPDQAHHPRAQGPEGQPSTLRQRERPSHQLDKGIHKRRNEVERTISALKGFRAVATRFDKRGYVFHGAVTVAAVRLWLRSSRRRSAPQRCVPDNPSAAHDA
ncbi:hypothetical protein DY245_25410 [Streptomyces inhibens]|uniref:Uncharacterized protein n=1 Tax=Streptomyces inhibens TaxID=2293571 RepID=A0A371PZ29_STRIH|nr:hypothetical protein DY245_25410 [Streptomyces inhibens]